MSEFTSESSNTARVRSTRRASATGGSREFTSESSNTARVRSTRRASATGGSRREELAARQAQLLRALLADGEPPPGFTADELTREANALRAKRRRVTALLRPDVAEQLGEQYAAAFDRFARTHPKSVDTRAREDADDFATWATAEGLLAAPRRPWWKVKARSTGRR